MKTVTDEYLEQNKEKVEKWYQEYTKYVNDAKMAAIMSLIFYVIGWGSFFLILCLYGLLKWKLLVYLCVFIMFVVIFGGLIIGICFKGIKPVFKMCKYYWISAVEISSKINSVLGSLPFIGWIFWVLKLAFDLWVICFFIYCWISFSPLMYFLAYLFFKKATKGHKQGIEWHERRKANNYADAVDKAEE